MNSNEENTKILLEIGKKKFEIEEEIKKMDRHIFDLESKYLEMTQHTGNIIKGWEQIFVPKPKIHSITLQNNYKKQKFTLSERIFSQTSYDNPLLKEESSSYANVSGNTVNGINTTFLKKKKKIHSLSLKKRKQIDDESYKISEKDSNEE